MKDIKCPKDIGFTNIFKEGECESAKYYGDCYHCWQSSIADMKHKEVYNALTQLIKSGIHFVNEETICDADELFIKIYSEDALRTLNKSLKEQV